MQTTDDILFSAHGPDPIPTASTEVVGTPGNALNVYWIVSHFPIGSVVSGPFPQKSSPNVLDDENYVHISWLPTLGASSYDLLFTRRLELPKQPGNFALALNLTETEFRDEGQSLSEYDLAGIRYGAPQQEWIFFDNRDRKQPTLRFIPWPIEVSSIIFEDGSSLSTAGAAGGAAPPNQSIQFNNNGAFGGSPNLIWDNVDLRIGLGTQNPVQPLHIVNPNGLGYIRLESFSPNLTSLYSGLEFYTSGQYVAEIGAWVHNDPNDGLSIDVGAFIGNLFISHVSGYVGINTGLGVPQAQLDVRGSALVVVPTGSNMEVWNGSNRTLQVSDTGVLIDQMSVPVPYLLQVRGNSRMGISGQTELYVFGTGVGFGGGAIEMWTAANPSIPAFQVALNGNVGIGTNNPQAQLDVIGFTGFHVGAPFTPTGQGVSIVQAGGARGFISGGTYGAYHELDIDASPLLLCRPDQSGGRVGIGILSPQYELDVFAQINISYNTGAPGGLGFLSFSNTVLATTDQRLVMLVAQAEPTIDSGQILFQTASAGVLAERMRIDSQGRVDITGSLFINGVQVLP